MKSLFSRKLRTDKSPSKHNDNIFHFIDRSADSRFAEIRRTLNKWFANYPSIEKEELRIRLKKDFDPAFYELFLHELFYKQGFKIQIHPKIQGSSKCPDFLISKNDFEFYLEAKVANDKSEKEKAIENKINTFYDQLNMINSPNFYLRIIDLKFKSEKQPKLKKAIKYLEEEIKKHHPDNYTSLMVAEGFEKLPEFVYEDNDFYLKLSILPKSKKGRSRKDCRPIGLYPIELSWGGADTSIKTSLEKKAGRYGKMMKPYIICINSFSKKGTDDIDVLNALFGSLQVTSWINRKNPTHRREKLTRAKDGFFLSPSGPQFTRVSGIFITNVHIGNIYTTNHWLIKHPFAQHNLDFSNFNLSYIEVIENKIHRTDKKTIGDILQK